MSASGCSERLAQRVALVFALLTVWGLWFRNAGEIRAAYAGTPAAFRVRLRSLFTFLFVLRPAWLVALVGLLAGPWLPKGSWLWLWFGLLTVLLYAISTGIAYETARALGMVLPARPAVRRAVERARRELPTNIRGVDELTWLMPNALALPLLGRVGFTQAAANALDEDALYAIALHELAHLSEPKRLAWVRPFFALALLPIGTATLLLGSGFELVLLALVPFSVLLLVLGLRLTRRLEHAADARAAEHSIVYANALEALHRAAGIPAVMSKRTTHPSLYDRMLAAGAAPSYPRPEPPRMLLPWLAFVMIPFFLIGFELLSRPIRSALAQSAGDQAAVVQAALGGREVDLLRVASLLHDDPVLRELLIDHALERAPDDRWVLREVARLRRMDCRAIRQMLASSRGRRHHAEVPGPAAFWQCRNTPALDSVDSEPEDD